MSDGMRRNRDDVFGETIRAVIDEIFTDDCVFSEPNGIYHGRDEIDRIAGSIDSPSPFIRSRGVS